VELGQRAEVTIDAFPDSLFAGTVTEIGNSPLRVRTGSSREAVDFEVKITLDGTLPNIRPGLSAKADIQVAERKDAVAVPLGARPGLAPEVRGHPPLQRKTRPETGRGPGRSGLRGAPFRPGHDRHRDQGQA